jgi:hypothetical protein
MQSETEDRRFTESSRTGALMVELDAEGLVVRVQIEPEVTGTWSADVLAERLVHLHRMALMRARCAQRLAWNEGGADFGPTAAYPSESDVHAYRREFLVF